MARDNSLKAAVVGGIIAGISTLAAAVAPLFVSPQPEADTPQQQSEAAAPDRASNTPRPVADKPGAGPRAEGRGRAATAERPSDLRGRQNR